MGALTRRRAVLRAARRRGPGNARVARWQLFKRFSCAYGSEPVGATHTAVNLTFVELCPSALDVSP
eukprot:260973-Pleurochrysis_carterae.AAC.1